MFCQGPDSRGGLAEDRAGDLRLSVEHERSDPGADSKARDDCVAVWSPFGGTALGGVRAQARNPAICRLYRLTRGGEAMILQKNDFTEFLFFRPRAKHVYLAGDFNGWRLVSMT